PVAETSGHCFATVLYNENTNSDVWRRRRPALSDTAPWGVRGADPIVNAQRDGVPRKASWTRTRARRNSETAARRFLIRLLEPLLNRATVCSAHATTHATAQHGSSESPASMPFTTSRSRAIAAVGE